MSKTKTEELRKELAELKGNWTLSCGKKSTKECKVYVKKYGGDKYCEYCEADFILKVCKESGLEFVTRPLQIGGAVNPYRDTSLQSSVAYDVGKFGARDAIIKQIEPIEVE